MEIIEKHFKTTSGRHLVVCDNVFEMSEVNYFKDFVENSFFGLGSVSSSRFEDFKKNETFFQSQYTSEDIERFRIFLILQNRLPKYFNSTIVERAWVNATFSGNTYRYHCDRIDFETKKPKRLEDCNILTVLYYCNIRWNIDDGGETIFCDDYGDPEIAVGFKPSRIVIFDPRIPHKPGFTRPNENDPRFSFTLGIKKL